MEKLKELISILTPNQVKTITIVGNGNQKGTKIHELYDLITAEKATSDEEAFQMLYPDTKSKSSYYKLKHELRERLYNTLFFIDGKNLKISTRQQKYLRCQWLLALASILTLAKAWQNVLLIARKALAIAMEFEFTNEAISSSRKLMMMSRVRGSNKEVNGYSLTLIDHVMLQQKETYAEAYWAQLGIAYVRQKSYRSDISYRASNYKDQLDRIESSVVTMKLIYLETMIGATAKMAAHDFAAAVPILTPALERVANYPKFTDPTYTYGIAVNLLACHISLKNHAEANQLLDLLYQNLVPGTYNWYKTRELHFILVTHTRHYAAAWDLFTDTTTQKTYPKQPQFVREAWTVYGAYLHILRLAGRLPKLDDKKFRLRRYLNELPVFARDKRGHNVTVLISQIILMLQRKNFDGLIDRFEAVNKYRERYVSREVNFRSNVFLHMLREVNRKNFDKSAVLAATGDLRLRLDEEPVDVISPGYDQEVLPYEDLWEILTEYLED